MLQSDTRQELQDWLLLVQLVFFVSAAFLSFKAMTRQLDKGR